MPKITPWQIKFPKQAQLVGALLSGYGELEFELQMCVASGMGDSTVAFRAMFRMRNESQRLDLAEALIAPAIKHYKLTAEFAHALGAIRHCRKIRNNFAHCHWHHTDDPPALRYCNMEEAAQATGTETILHFKPASEKLLTDQVSFFGYCSDWFAYIHHEMEVRAGRLESHDWLKPKVRSLPSIHSQGKKSRRR
jgi:hypothetical protein